MTAYVAGSDVAASGHSPTAASVPPWPAAPADEAGL